MWVPKSVFIASKARLDTLIDYELSHLANTRYRASRGSARIQKQVAWLMLTAARMNLRSGSK